MVRTCSKSTNEFCRRPFCGSPNLMWVGRCCFPVRLVIAATMTGAVAVSGVVLNYQNRPYPTLFASNDWS